MSTIDKMIWYLLAMSEPEKTNYARREEWQRIHADIMGKLDLPCKLEWSRRTKVGAHVFRDDHSPWTCALKVNPDGNFFVPAHLILHEAAHHRNIIKKFGEELDFDLSPLESQCCLGGWSSGHCPHWAAELVECYRICDIELPQSTQFHEFAKAANIEWRPYFPAVDGSVGKE